MSLLFPLSFGCEDQNVVSITKKMYKEIIPLVAQKGQHLCFEHQVCLHSWQLPLTDTAVLWKSLGSPAGCEGNSDDVMTADELWKCSFWLDVWTT